MNFAPARIPAAAWALVFAAVHVVWSTGSTVLLGDAAAGRMTGAFLVYDVAVSVACLVGLFAALWGRRWMLVVIAVLVGLRGLIGLAQAGVDLVRHDSPFTATFWVEPFFVLGAVLFTLAATHGTRPLTPTAPTPQLPVL